MGGLFDREMKFDDKYYNDVVDGFKSKEIFTKPNSDEIKLVANNKVVKYTINEDDDEDIQLLKLVINSKTVTIQDFINHFGNSVGYNTYNGLKLKHRKSIQLQTRKKLAWMLGIGRLVGSVAIGLLEKITSGASTVIVIDSEDLDKLEDAGIPYDTVLVVRN